MRALLALVVLVFVAMSLAPAEVSTMREDERAVRKVLADYADSWNQCNHQNDRILVDTQSGPPSDQS